jgi:hypothetical protein
MMGHFHAIDPAGRVFRYPLRHQGQRAPQDHKLINVEVLRDHMREAQAEPDYE